MPPSPDDAIDEGGEAPQPPARVPNRGRHVLRRVRRVTRRKRRNAVVDNIVDMQADIDAINAGSAERNGNLWTVSGRPYHVEASGHAWPVSGAGSHTLDRAAFLALGIYNEYGMGEAAERLLDLEEVAESDRAEARGVFAAGQDVG